MKLLETILAALIVLSLAGCTAQQRANCGICRFVAGQWVCRRPTSRPVEPARPEPHLAYDFGRIDPNALPRRE